jgi:uncharacterized protein (DUF362 family)
MHYTRRTFIKTTAACGLAAGAGPLLCRIAAAAENPAATVASVTGPRPAATRKAIELLGGMEAFVKKDSRVILKPNMSWASPIEAAVNTHPEVVAAVATMCVAAGAREILVIDHTINAPEKCLQMSGIQEACRGIKNVRVFAINHKKLYRTIAVPRGKVLRSVDIARDVPGCDTFINLPCAKSHTTTGVTLGIKNLMGIIWNRRAFHSDFDINQALADLTSAVKISLTIVDASRALTTAGPAVPGLVTEPNTIIAGVDPVAVDAVSVGVADWYGRKTLPSQIQHIAAANAMGLGTIQLERIEVKRAAV